MQLSQFLHFSDTSPMSKDKSFSLLHTTQSNISSATGASESNSRHTAPSINVFDIDIDIDKRTT